MKVVWTDPAVDQLGDIYEYVSRDSIRSANQLIARIVRQSEQIGEFPRSGRSVPEFQLPNVREVLEHPYRIIYMVGKDNVDILAVVHGARRFPPPSPGQG